MAMYEIPQRIKHRRGTYTELYQRNEVLLSGEECFETHDADGIEHSPWKCKVGDGSTPWNDLEYESTGGGGTTPTSLDGVIGCTFDGGEAVLEVGTVGYIKAPFDGEIVSWTVMADRTGTLVVDVWKDVPANYPPLNADSITASAPVSVSGVYSEDVTLTGWTKTFSKGDVFAFHIDSCTLIQSAVVTLHCVRSS